jgi:hypothetical protein
MGFMFLKNLSYDVLHFCVLNHSQTALCSESLEEYLGIVNGRRDADGYTILTQPWKNKRRIMLHGQTGNNGNTISLVSK